MYHRAKPAASDRRQPQNSKRNTLTHNGTAIGGAPKPHNIRKLRKHNQNHADNGNCTPRRNVLPTLCPQFAHDFGQTARVAPRFRGRGRATHPVLQPACCSASHALNTTHSTNPSARTAKHTHQSPLQTMAVALLPASSQTDRMPAFTRIETLSSTGWLRNYFVKLP